MEREANRTNDDDNNEALRSQLAIRCVRATMLLLSMKPSQNLINNHQIEEDEEREMLLRAVADLKIELVKERLKKKGMRIWSLIEITLQILVVLSFLSFCLILAFGYSWN